ncbi:hypothetical protein AAFF_G00026520 [Aldrovandia affinis]|uniref:Uncharacterized protein n=1 Tax=Aldrovandia affinis TaxID=143900 RepID=A0AAD7S4Q3_9TELE|nr:hypothetical protein AAFF_G00026520 [Aldrovandia affinis]
MQESQDQATDEYARALGDAQTRLAQKEAELRKAAENHASEAEQLRCRVEQESRDTHQVEANALREQLAQLEKSVEQEKAQNQELQAVQEKALRGESEKHGQQLKELRDQLEKSVEQEKAQNQELQTEQEKLLAQRDDVSSQLQEVNRANSRLLEQLTERGQEKDKLQQELEATRKTADKRKAMLDELAIDVAQEKSRHKEELSDAWLQHEKEVLGMGARYEKELRGLHEDKNRTEEEIRSQLRDEKARTRELESLQQTVEELQAQIQSMEGTKGWFERGLKEAEETAEKSALEHQEQEEQNHLLSEHRGGSGVCPGRGGQLDGCIGERGRHAFVGRTRCASVGAGGAVGVGGVPGCCRRVARERREDTVSSWLSSRTEHQGGQSACTTIENCKPS